MHSNESAVASGAVLLHQLGRLIVRSRSGSPTTLTRRHKLSPSTSKQIVTQPKADTSEPLPGIEAQLDDHVHALWNDQIPICIDVLLAPECQDCYSSMCRPGDKLRQRGLLLERWAVAITNKNPENASVISPHWLLSAVRSQLHFSQLCAWRATLHSEDRPAERRRKLSRESCNFKKIEANCDETELEERKLNIIYSIKLPGETSPDFSRPPTDHTFPLADIGTDLYLKVSLESLPRLDKIPHVKCTCKRRPGVDDEELVGKLNDLTLGPRKYPSDAINSNVGVGGRRLSTEYLYSSCDKQLLDDRMLTPCSESGKHKCNCDDESDDKKQETKTLDERRLKEIAKYKRRLRKESKLKKLCDSTSSDGEAKKETHTSIPILQAARFDRFRAIGRYRNQTYLTLPASRIESRSPFVEPADVPPFEFKRTNTIGTQTDDIQCQCGNAVEMKCPGCLDRGMVRSEGSYDLALIENGTRRKYEEDERSLKKLKCDINSDISSDKCDEVIKRPKLRRFFPIVDRIERVINDRVHNNDIAELNLRDDDTVFSVKPEPKRQKTYSINEDYVCFEKCDYGSIDKCDMESPRDEDPFKFPDNPESNSSNGEVGGSDDRKYKPFENVADNNLDVEKTGQSTQSDAERKGQENQIPSPTEMDRFRWRFDSAASMVFHTKTGLPLTSSPAPLRRGNNCFDFDDSINGVSGIKSALFHPISPPSPAAVSPVSPTRPRPPHPRTRRSAQLDTPQRKKTPATKLRIGTSTGLLGSFEESALKGRLEPVATVHGFTAELGASGAFCPPHRRLPVTVFFYAPGGTNAPYMGHINLGPGGYRVARSGTIQVSLFNPHGTLVKMFVVLYDLTNMPPLARTFLRQRTLYMPAGADPPKTHEMHKWLRYLIHLRFMTSKSGKLYLHTDIRILVSRKADVDTATAHSALFRPIPTNHDNTAAASANQSTERQTDQSQNGISNRTPNRVFGGCSDFDSEIKREIGYENQSSVSYELRSFTYAPENPRYSPR
ncbi:protein FAM214A isoform X1 [Pieris brassicae]|uniref:protein FAM214A isoform X1 n=1 Tax=Pieris brassicae TaxID=7116 RepID=UPI001E65E86F|nr:protein FAM214A isoform X1 [Pieris brassicae]